MFCRTHVHVFILLNVLVIGSVAPAKQIQDAPRKFPDGFLFGTATSAYQIEGAWNVDGKGMSHWDYLVNLDPNPIYDGTNGNDAAKSYYLYERDIEMLRELGVDHYRFSLSWPRLLPTGFSNEINPAGVDYYNRVINGLLRYNITPVVTLYHWDIPHRFQQLGGWANPAIIDWFGDLSRVAFELFGDRVKYWVTINEPTQICHYGYGLNWLAPYLNFRGYADYKCARNVLLGHARSYHIYDQDFRASQGGKIFITLSAEWWEPESEEHIEAAREAIIFDLDQYAHPIFSEAGDWPPFFREKIANKSAEQGFSRSRLQDFTQEEVDYMRGTSDYFGLNHYSTYYVYRNQSVVGAHQIPSREDDMDLLTYQLPEWQLNPVYGPVKVVPWGFHKLLNYIREEYANPPVYITENGYGTLTGLVDDDRVYYFRTYLNAMLDAIDEGSDIRAYTAWSLMDNFEWTHGFTNRMGLYEVDYNDENRTRTPRKSAYVFREILRTRTLDFDYEPVMPDLPDSAPVILTRSVIYLNTIAILFSVLRNSQS